MLNALRLFSSRHRQHKSPETVTQPPQPLHTQLRICGRAMVQVVDASTGKALGFRSSVREAQWLQQALEREALTPTTCASTI